MENVQKKNAKTILKHQAKKEKSKLAHVACIVLLKNTLEEKGKM